MGVRMGKPQCILGGSGDYRRGRVRSCAFLLGHEGRHVFGNWRLEGVDFIT